MRRRLPPCLLVVALVGAGCGNDPVERGDLRAAEKPTRLLSTSYPDAGAKFEAPEGWRRAEGTLPRVVTFSSGEAVLAIFAYRRKEPSPPEAEALGRARKRLVRQARRRDKNFKIRKAQNTKVAGRPAIEITGTQTIGGVTLETRSVHVFKKGGEYVFEALAPAGQFRLLDASVVTPLLKSLKVTGKVKRSPREELERKRREAKEKRERKKQDEDGGDQPDQRR